jgi:uncharacterized membrane protein
MTINCLFLFTQTIKQMKNILIILAAVAALSSCVEHKRPTSSPTKKVRAKLAARLADRVVISRTTSIIEVDTMYQVSDTIHHGNSMFVIVK